MKELHRKDPASHAGPESCEADRKDCSEALTGEDAGEVLSHEIREPVMPTPLSEAEGNMVPARYRERTTDPAWS